MSNKISNHPDHDEIVSLLPWFVNQTLDERQRGVVLSHIEHCDDCQHEAQFLKSLNEAVKDDAQNNYARHADIDKDLASVMQGIYVKSQKPIQ